MSMASSMAALHLIDQEDQNEGQQDFFGHVMHLVLELASYDAHDIFNGRIACLSFRWSK